MSGSDGADGAAAGKLQAKLHGLFPTPVAMTELPNPERLNAALAEAIKARQASRPSTRHSNLGGWQSSWDFEDWAGAAGRELIATAKRFALELTSDRQGRPVRLEWQANSWANVNGPGHGNEFHTHPGAFWSGSYYVDVGDIGSRPDVGGELEFQDPRGVAPAMYAPNLAIRMPGALSMGGSETIAPRAGMLLLFPSWLSHAVRPYHGTRPRISVAFNLSLPQP